MSKVGGRIRKKVQYLFNKQIIQNNKRREKVVAQCYSMVKIPHA
jgi:hypothetical protein